MNGSQGISFNNDDLNKYPDVKQGMAFRSDFTKQIDSRLTRSVQSIITKYPGSDINVVFANIDNNKILLDIDSQEKIVAASLIKLLILIESLHQKTEYKNFDAPISLKSRFKASGAGLLKYSPDDYTTYESVNKNLLNYLMIVNSDNYATNLLIDNLTFGKINDRAEKLGLKQTRLKNMLMLLRNDFIKPTGNTTSLLDMAKSMKYMYFMSKQDSVFKEGLMILGHQCDRSGIPSALPVSEVGKTKLYNKTGTLNNTRYDVALIETSINTYVLGVGVVNRNHKENTIIVELSRKIFQYY